LKVTLVIICLTLIGVLAYTEIVNKRNFEIIAIQQNIINNQQLVITAITGVKIPKGSIVTPTDNELGAIY
jgi:hypothetical protein